MKIKAPLPKFFNAIEKNLRFNCPQKFKKVQRHCLPLYLENAFNQAKDYSELLRRSRLICMTFQNGELSTIFEKTTIPLFERISCILKTQDFPSIIRIKKEELVQYIELDPIKNFPTLLKLTDDNILILNKIEPNKLAHTIHRYPQLIPEILKSHSTYTLSAIQKATWRHYLMKLSPESRVQILQCALLKYHTKVNFLVRSILRSIVHQEDTALSEATSTQRIRSR